LITAEKVQMVNEGGCIEVDGRGTLMAKRSSILNQYRNRGATQHEVEQYFGRFLGVTNFIWLDGTPGLEITDDQIDGTARFANGNTIVTHRREDFFVPTEYNVLVDATDAMDSDTKSSIFPLMLTGSLKPVSMASTSTTMLATMLSSFRNSMTRVTTWQRKSCV
jgi:agmatine/peptidylarginine deiminase